MILNLREESSKNKAREKVTFFYSHFYVALLSDQIVLKWCQLGVKRITLAKSSRAWIYLGLTQTFKIGRYCYIEAGGDPVNIFYAFFQI